MCVCERVRERERDGACNVVSTLIYTYVHTFQQSELENYMIDCENVVSDYASYPIGFYRKNVAAQKLAMIIDVLI